MFPSECGFPGHGDQPVDSIKDAKYRSCKMRSSEKETLSRCCCYRGECATRYKTPCSTMARATFMNPAMFAPFM